MSAQTDVSPSALAGRWYPADPDRLARTVDQYLDQAELPEIAGEVVGVVTPHAGHQYSGAVAGHAFAAVEGLRPDLVVILSPLHQPARDPLLVTSHPAYQTPLGTVPVQHQLLDEINRSLETTSGLTLSHLARDEEHSIEIVLPFLQRALEEDFAILPIMIRRQEQELMHALTESLQQVLADRDPLLVASTDLSHFYTARQAEELDQTLIEAITSLDPKAVFRADREGTGFACGKGALATVLWASQALGANRAYHLKYSHSGRITGDNSRVVGYEAAALVRD